MYALTVWQPWAWAIGAGIKRVENRDWVPNWKLVKTGDDIAIHGGMHAPTRDDMHAFRLAARGHLGVPTSSDAQELGTTYGRGRIVAIVTFTGIARAKADLPEDQVPWWVGKYGWLFSNVRQLNLTNAPKVLGQQGLWALPMGVEETVKRQLEPHNRGQLWRKTA